MMHMGKEGYYCMTILMGSNLGFPHPSISWFCMGA